MTVWPVEHARAHWPDKVVKKALTEDAGAGALDTGHKALCPVSRHEIRAYYGVVVRAYYGITLLYK